MQQIPTYIYIYVYICIYIYTHTHTYARMHARMHTHTHTHTHTPQKHLFLVKSTKNFFQKPASKIRICVVSVAKYTLDAVTPTQHLLCFMRLTRHHAKHQV